jgi:CRP-like cAMP-binding protein
MMTLISYPSGSTIDQQGNEIDKVRIICKGKLDVFMMLPNGKKVCLDSLEEGDYYGEELYFDKERRKSQKCLFTTIALQDCDIGYVPAAELQLLVEDKLKLSSNTSRAQDPYEIENLYHDQLDKLYWIKTRRKQIKRLIREWTGDPNIKSSWSNQYEMEKYGEKLY